MTLLEDRIRRHVGHDGEPQELILAKSYIIQALDAGTPEEIEAKVRADFRDFEPEEVPDLYQKPERAWYEVINKIEDGQKYKRSEDARAAVELRNTESEQEHGEFLQIAIDSAKRHADKTTLYDSAVRTLSPVMDNIVPLRGTDFTPIDVDQANFLSHYVDSRRRLAEGLHEAAFESLEYMIGFADKSFSPGLKGSKDALVLEQARVMIDARIYPRVLEIAGKVDDSDSFGEAPYVRGIANFAMEEFSAAAAEFTNAFTINPEYDDVPGKIIDIFKTQISRGQVDEAITSIDRMINISDSPIDEGRKQTLLVEQANQYWGQEDLDLTYQIADMINDKAVHGQASYIRGEVDLKLGNLSRAATQFKNAFVINRYLLNIEEKVLDVFDRQIENGQIDEAVHTLDMMMEVMDSPFDEERKNSLLLAQTRAVFDNQEYDRAYELASKVDDVTSLGQSAYWKGEVRFEQEDYGAAAAQFRIAHYINPDLQFPIPVNWNPSQSTLYVPAHTYPTIAMKVGQSFNRLAKRAQDPVINYENLGETGELFKDAEHDMKYGRVDGAKVKFDGILSALEAAVQPEPVPEPDTQPEPFDDSLFTSLRTSLDTFNSSISSLVEDDDATRKSMIPEVETNYESLRQSYSTLVSEHQGILKGLTRQAETDLTGLESYVQEIKTVLDNGIKQFVPPGNTHTGTVGDYTLAELKGEIDLYAAERAERKEQLEGKEAALPNKTGDDKKALQKEVYSLRKQVKYRDGRIENLEGIYATLEPTSARETDSQLSYINQRKNDSADSLNTAVNSMEGYLDPAADDSPPSPRPLTHDEKALKAFTLYNLAKVERQNNNPLEAAQFLDQSLAVMETKSAFNNFSDLYYRQMRQN